MVFLCVKHAGMPRKFRFYHRKNSERKKRRISSSSDVYDSSHESSSDQVTHELSSEATPLLTSNPSPANGDIGSCEGPESALRALQSSVVLPVSWSDHSSANLENMLLCRISSQPSCSTVPLRITHCLKVDRDLSWSLYVNQHHVDTSKCGALKSFPKTLNAGRLSQLLTKLDGLSVCAGQSDVHFVKMVAAKKGKIVSPDGKVAAYVDDDSYTKTVRTADCELICPSAKCESCKAYRANLRSIYNRWSKQRGFDGSDTSSHTNDRYLNTPEKKAKMDSLRKRAHNAEEEVKRLKDKVRTLLQQGENVDNELHSDLVNIMKENADEIRKVYPENSFSRLFWDEQLKAASAKDPRQVRWHPVLIKWCLNLKLLSSSAYHAMRTSGFLKLPSERTLRDYVHYFSNRPGFQKEVHQQLLEEAKIESLPEDRRFVCLILDEMKIKEGLVYNKHSGELIGFTHLGDINNELMKLERGDKRPPIANHVLTIMVRGLLFKLEFPYAHFGTEGVTADFLYPIVWEAIRLLEADGVKVLCITADGASPNRKFFKMHKTPDVSFPHKAKNPYAKEERWVFFISDPPHLIKTVRNCWSHSGVYGTRHMEVNKVECLFCIYVIPY